MVDANAPRQHGYAPGMSELYLAESYEVKEHWQRVQAEVYQRLTHRGRLF